MLGSTHNGCGMRFDRRIMWHRSGVQRRNPGMSHFAVDWLMGNGSESRVLRRTLAVRQGGVDPAGIAWLRLQWRNRRIRVTRR